MQCEPLMDARKVAKLLGISLRTLDALAARGEAPAFIRIGHARRWRMAEINTWIEARLGITNWIPPTSRPLPKRLLANRSVVSN